MQLLLSIIFLMLAVVSWMAVPFFFVWGIPLGMLFLSFSIWFFAEWKYKKPIPLNISGWLFLLPVLGLFYHLTANRNFGLVHLFLGNIPVGVQAPSWAIFLGVFDAFILPLFWWGALLWIIIHFFHKIPKNI